MFDDDDTDFLAGFVLGMFAADSGRSTGWNWRDFIVYGITGITALVVFGGIAWISCR